MYSIVLKRPEIEDREQVMAYQQAHFAIGDHAINGGAGLNKIESYDEWLERSKRNGSEETAMPGLVPESTYLAIRLSDQKLVGIINIRHRLNDYLFAFGGHIGYGVLPGERGKGYGTQMLELALEKCRKMDMDRVLLTCDKKNPASAKVMLHNGAVLENEVLEDGEITQRYWIDLK